MGRARGLFKGRWIGRGSRRWPVPLAAFVVGVGMLGLSGCVADPPPIMRGASAGDGRAVVTWFAPVASPVPVTGYVVTPWIGFVRQTPVVFNSTSLAETVTGLTNGVTHTFTVHGITPLGHTARTSTPY